MHVTDRWDRIKAIFEDAMAVPTDRRSALLDEACAGDPELRAELQHLVDNSTDSSDFLEPKHRERIMPLLKADSPIFATNDLIGGRYKTVSFIARGGMGEVYEVEDTELKTRVALKTLAISESSSEHRFKREILLARTVTHPNVCRVFDFGHHEHPEHGDVVFLTMELLHGETLAGIIRREGPMGCEQAGPLLQQMLAALSAAHQLNVIHRDFKPGNVILLESGANPAIKVTDFGLAKSVISDETSATSYGQIIGTPDYMPPEQFQGKCSKETDVYAFGLTVIEMLTGKLPISRAKPFENGQIDVWKKVPARWRRVILKCLEMEPSNRFHDAEEVREAFFGSSSGFSFGLKYLSSGLKSLVAVTVLITAVIFVVTAINLIRARGLAGETPNITEQKHIAVLPFQNIGGTTTTQAFADGVVESLTSDLSQLERYHESLWVVPSSDSRNVKTLEDAYHNLKVNLAITGSIQQTADGVRVTTNLIDARGHKQLASRSFNVAAAQLYTLQDQVWESVADMIDLEVNPRIIRDISAGGTQNPSAYRMYTEGIGQLKLGDLEEVKKAIVSLGNAVDEDRHYALAYAALGDAYATHYFLTKETASIDKATKMVHRAIELNDKLVAVHITLGKIYKQTGHPDEALVEFREVLAKDPAEIEAQYYIGDIYAAQGKTSEAEAAYKAVIARKPKYWLGYSGLGTLYYKLGDFANAADQFKAMIDYAPNNAIGYQDLGGAYLGMGKYDDAVNILRKGLSIKGTASAWSNLGSAYLYLGRNEDATSAMLRAATLNPHNDVLWRNLGDSYEQIPGKSAEAKQAYSMALSAAEEELHVNANDVEPLSGLALYQAHLGRSKDADRSIAKALSLAPKDGDVWFTSALVYEIDGEQARALTALDRAVKSGYSLQEIDKEPELRALHSDPRYQRWLRQREAKAGISGA